MGALSMPNICMPMPTNSPALCSIVAKHSSSQNDRCIPMASTGQWDRKAMTPYAQKLPTIVQHVPELSVLPTVSQMHENNW